jgi:hypothetical protein
MLLRVRELRQEGDERFVAVTLNKGDVPVSLPDAQLIQAVLERSNRELEPLIATLYPVFPAPEAIPVEFSAAAA